MEKLLTVGELQKYLQVGRSKAYEIVNLKDFPAIRLGKSIRIPQDQLDEWIEKQVKEVE